MGYTNSVSWTRVNDGPAKKNNMLFWISLHFDSLHPSQQFFSHAGTISCLPGLNLF